MADPQSLLIFKLREKQSEAAQKKEGQKPEEKKQQQEYAYPTPSSIIKQAEAVKQQVEQQQRAQAQVKQQPVKSIQESKYPNPRSYYMPDKANKLEEYNKGLRKNIEVKGKAQSRNLAKNQFCAWHQWRHAYAICAFCHRPFCYEDCVEYRNGYYCTEDIDSVEQRRAQKLRSEYNATSLLSTFILLGAFLAFLYFAGGQLIYIFNYAIQVGAVSFIFGISWSYLLALVALVIMMLSLAVAIYQLTASRRSNISGIVIGVIAVAFFSYMYINTNTNYMAIMALLEFAAFISSVYAAATAVKVYDQHPSSAEQYELLYWPNVSKF